MTRSPSASATSRQASVGTIGMSPRPTTMASCPSASATATAVRSEVAWPSSQLWFSTRTTLVGDDVGQVDGTGDDVHLVEAGLERGIDGPAHDRPAP